MSTIDMSKETTARSAMKLALEALQYIYEGANNQGPHTGISWRCVSNKAAPVITALRQALASEALDKKAENARELGLDYEPAQQEPVAKVCHDLDGHIGWNPNLRQLPDEGAALYTSLPTLSLAQRPHECSRSHPHENMNAMCELRTEIARLTNENARLKAMHQNDEINTYRMTLLCIRDGLQQGMSKSIQKLQAREINDVLGLPSFASYRTSTPPQRKPLTDEAIATVYWGATGQSLRPQDNVLAHNFARSIEAAHGIKEKNSD